MCKNKTIIYLFTAVFLAVAVFILIYHAGQETDLPFSVRVSSGEGTEQINCWKSEEDEYYVFLPSYADMSQVQIYLNTENSVSIEGKPLTERMSCEAFQLNTPYNLTYTAWGRTYTRSINFVKSGGVATMYIDTQSGNMDYIHEKKGNEESGNITLYTVEGNLNYSGTLESINGRGNNTWEAYDKKPYSMTLLQEADLLGMGRAKKWILLANAGDPSNLRNKIVYEFANAVGLDYSPNSQWVDLYLNDEYVGLYLLCERNEVHSERIDIAEEGSFLVSLERKDRLEAQNYTYVSTKSEQFLRVHYPLDISVEALVALERIWQGVENAILAEDGIAPIMGKSWLELIDLDSWAKKYLIEEIFGSGDACYISQYFYCDGNGGTGKIFAGPVWDFDHSMGEQSAWQLLNPNTLYANRLHVKDGYDTPWFYYLLQKEEFYDRMIELYQVEFLPLLENLFSNDLSEYVAQISQASVLNQIRWNISENIFTQSEYIGAYMTDRIAFLSSFLIDRFSFCSVKADRGFGGFYAYYAVEPGQILVDLPTFSDTESSVFLGWYYADTDEPFDPAQPITEDIEIYAKWEDSASNKLDNILKLIPLGVIAVLFIVMFVADIKRMKRGG